MFRLRFTKWFYYAILNEVNFLFSTIVSPYLPQERPKVSYPQRDRILSGAFFIFPKLTIALRSRSSFIPNVRMSHCPPNRALLFYGRTFSLSSPIRDGKTRRYFSPFPAQSVLILLARRHAGIDFDCPLAQASLPRNMWRCGPRAIEVCVLRPHHGNLLSRQRPYILSEWRRVRFSLYYISSRVYALSLSVFKHRPGISHKRYGSLFRSRTQTLWHFEYHCSY